mmetsp:Transcript_2917/g.5517  ORF Transcript_2917/g.5517 Transcript_2917/m.5517 type:complete len:264 (+) Transcript_2917:75-866(+)
MDVGSAELPFNAPPCHHLIVRHCPSSLGLHGMHHPRRGGGAQHEHKHQDVRQQQHRPALMRRRQMDRGSVQHRRDPQRHLQHHHPLHQPQGPRDLQRRGGPGVEEGQGGDEGQRGVGVHAVVELHRHVVVEDAAPPGVEVVELVQRDQLPCHRGPLVVHEPGVQTRHKAPGSGGEQRPAQRGLRHRAEVRPRGDQLRDLRQDGGPHHAHGRPDEGGVQRERPHEVQREAEVRHTHARPVLKVLGVKARSHHEPADGPLQPDQR